MQESYPCPSPVAVLGRVGPAPCLDSTAELTLVVVGQVSQLEGENVEDLVPSLVCHEMAWEGSPLPPHPSPRWQLGDLAHGVMRTGELALPLTGCSPWGVYPAPGLDSTVELVLMEGT